MFVYRFEHVGCEGAPEILPAFHGPHTWPEGCRSGRWEAPEFGGNGPGPRSDRWREHLRSYRNSNDELRLNIADNEICLVTEDQFDFWWSYDSGSTFRLDETSDWKIVEYLVNFFDIRIGVRQCIARPNVLVRHDIIDPTEDVIEYFASVRNESLYIAMPY